jgi:hypothetical protein
LNHFGRGCPLLGAKEHRGPEDAFEGSNETPIFFSAFVHPECLQHLRCGIKPNRLALLSHRHRREKDLNDTILPERNTILRMARNLENELSISTLI